jgi:Cell wall-associated hydrolases (invasion-associated proteins)
MPLQKYIYLIISLIILLVFPFAEVQSKATEFAASDSTRVNYLSQNEISLSDSVINYGKLFINTPYHYGSPGTSSFDCSGFTSYVYRNFGYNLERSSIDQSKQFNPVERTQLKAGDLVFFSGRKRSKNVGHVGIVVSAKENGEFNFIHAAVHHGVTISSSTEAYYTKRFLKASRVIGASPILTVFHKIMTKGFKSEPEAPKQAQVQAKTSLPALSAQQSVVKQTKRVVPAEYHKVKSGETLSSIAQKYGLTVAELKKKNNIKGNKLSLKQRIKVKDEETIVENINVPVNNAPRIAESSKATDQDASKSHTSHTVKKGETLSSIAKMYNMSVAELRRINNLPKGKIHSGQELLLNVQPGSDKNTETAKAEVPQKTSTHKVVSGESLFSIAKENNMTVEDLKKINNIPNGKIRPGQELKLVQQPEQTKNVEVAKVETPQKGATHKVVSGESLFSIAKQYNMSVEDLKKINNLPKGKIKPGQELKLAQQTEQPKPAKNIEVAKVEIPRKGATHKVASGESLYSISKMYNVSVDDLKKINNLAKGKIRPGQELKIVQDNDNATKNIAAEKSNNTKQVEKSENAGKTISYKVKKGESLISIAKDNNISVEDLKKMNNMTDSKIRFGQELKLTQSNDKPKGKGSKAESAPQSIQHKVKSGESFYSIAKKYGCTMEELKEWNKNSGGKIKIGQQVIIYPKGN